MTAVVLYPKAFHDQRIDGGTVETAGDSEGTVTVEHLGWQCPRCGAVRFYLGCMSHAKRCWVDWESWREDLRKTAE